MVYSVFLGKQEVLAVFMMLRRVDGSANELAHELILQCGTHLTPDPDGSYVSPEKVVPLPELCWTSAADFTPEQMQEHEDWHHSICSRIQSSNRSSPWAPRRLCACFLDGNKDVV